MDNSVNRVQESPPPKKDNQRAAGSQQTTRQRTEARRWWIKLILQPTLFLIAGVMLIMGLGAAQRLGWISASGGSDATITAANGENVRYICPMMCTPPQSEPGRCPVCAMELVRATSGGGQTDSRSIQIDSVARRVANIRTVPVKAMPISRTIRAIGELAYDEGTLKTISAYVDGRLERLYADYTGVVVRRGDHLALVYSPRLYSSQTELLLAKSARDARRSGTLPRVSQSNRDLYDSAKERLIELGMTQPQIDQLEQAGEANSRMHLSAPISGTVVEKFAVEGQYVKEGEAIYRLADLSTVWLMLQLFPDDVAAIRYGQKVTARVQSLPGRNFSGRVAFIDPVVDPQTRTVGVRVVIANQDGVLRVGDYATAKIDVPLTSKPGALYDPELADKWISPRHPHVIESSPGTCRVCGVELVPASQFGFAGEPSLTEESLVVPRSAVLMAGGHSLVYVESDPGRFEIRPVVAGPGIGDQIVILDGVHEGEQVAVQGNFLIDSQMQLAGNPSLIDPTKATSHMEETPFMEMDLPPIGKPQVLEPPKVFQPSDGSPTDSDESSDIAAALAELTPADRSLASRQQLCPVAGTPLGSMGTPIKVDVDGQPVFICCEGCRHSLLEQPARYLGKLGKETAP